MDSYEFMACNRRPVDLYRDDRVNHAVWLQSEDYDHIAYYGVCKEHYDSDRRGAV